MTDQVKNDILEICRESCKMQHDGELKYYKDMAMHIKKELDKKLGGSWHIIVGKYLFSTKLTLSRNKLRFFCQLRTQMHDLILVGARRLPMFQAWLNNMRIRRFLFLFCYVNI